MFLAFFILVAISAITGKHHCTSPLICLIINFFGFFFFALAKTPLFVLDSMKVTLPGKKTIPFGPGALVINLYLQKLPLIPKCGLNVPKISITGLRNMEGK